MKEYVIKYFSSSIFDLISYIAAFVSIFGTLLSLYLAKIQKSKILSSVENEKLESVLASDNILTLGNYLTDSLEIITIAQYSSNKDVSKNVNQFLNKVQNYLLRREEIEKIEIPKETEKQTRKETEEVFSELNPIPPDFSPILDELSHGEP